MIEGVFVPYASGFCRYSRDQMGRCFLSAVMKYNGENGTAGIFHVTTLSEGFRPVGHVDEVAIVNNNGTQTIGIVTLDADGEVYLHYYTELQKECIISWTATFLCNA